MEQKQKAILQILEIMQKEQISLEDLVYQLPPKEEKRPDLLCIVDGIEKRLPFAEGKALSPSGIFPSTSSSYLYIAESGKCARNTIREELLPTLSFFVDEVFPNIDTINAALTELDKPLLSGEYFASAPNGLNHIVRFRYGQKSLFHDVYYSNEIAKLRLCGHLDKTLRASDQNKKLG